MGVIIKSIEFTLGGKKENLENLLKENLNWDIKRIYSKTGIKNRYISKKEEDVVTLSISSANKTFKKFDKKKIDFLIFVTQTSSYKLPSLACILQNKLNLRTDIQAFDINMGCSGFIYALNLGEKIINSGQAKNGLIICSDVYTKYISKNNSSCRPIFSDASSAVILCKSNYNSIKKFVFGTDGGGALDLNLRENSKNITMNGSNVAIFAIKRVPEVIKEILKKTNNSIKNIDKFIFHQASKYVLDNIYRVLKIDKKRIFENYKNFGNTTSSSIPIALKVASLKKILKNNSKIILCGFGVGLSWGSVLLKWKKIN
jgi:3-oxoacyl-[acyl-carrier-protein] synthase-3